MKFLKLCTGLALCAGLSACGTTFSLPEVDAASEAQATKMFASPAASAPRPQLSAAQAERRFARVAQRVVPVARKYCDALMTDRPDFDCNAKVEIDRKLTMRNAYFTYEDKKPVVRLTLPLLQDTRNDDEVAFVMGHEFGHLLGRHIDKQRQQAVVGALILGGIAAAAVGSSPGQSNSTIISDSVEIGAAIGSVAYSQAYELESDTLGTHIAHDAGYDPVRGAEYFTRPDEPKRENGQLSFWGTHPPDAKRVATVIAAKKSIDAGQGLQISKPK